MPDNRSYRSRLLWSLQVGGENDGPRRMMGFDCMKFGCTISLLMTLAVVISGCGILSDADEKIYFTETRQPDELEYQYSALGSVIHSAKPCYLIHPDSLRKAGFNDVGSQVSFVRSSCFFVVAAATGDQDICANVRSVSTIFLSGADRNASLCRQVAGSGGFGDSLDVPAIVALAGYSQHEVDLYLASQERFSTAEVAMHYRQEQPDTYWGEVRRHLLHSADFFERIGSLPSFGTPADQAIMNAMTWTPRYQRPWVPPEQRTQSMPEARVPAQTAQE